VSPIISARGGLSSQAYGQFALSVAGGSYESIATVSVGSGGQSTVSFTSIPSTYKHLQVRILGKSTTSGTSVNDMFYQFNSDAGSNYYTHYLNGTGSSVYAGAAPSLQPKGRASNCLPYAGSTSIFGLSIIDILDYGSTSKYKTIRSLSGYDANGSGYINMDSTNWNSTTAISSISFTSGANNISEFSSFALYGIKD